MGETFQFVKHNFLRLWCSPRPYIVLFVLYMLLENCFGGVRTYLAGAGQTIQATELFVFANANRLPQWMLAFGMLLLLGDAPFLHEGVEFYILRSNRGRWLVGQVLFCAVTVLEYLLLVAGMFLFMFRGYLSFTNTWSDAITLSCQVQNGTWMNITMIMAFSMRVITSGSPYAMFGLSYLYAFLLLFLCSLLCMACNIKLRFGFGCFAVVVLLVWRVALENIGPVFFHYISPCNLASVIDRPVDFFHILYTISFFSCSCGLLYLWTHTAVQKNDLQRKGGL